MSDASGERGPAAPRWLRLAGDWRLQVALGAVALALAVAVGAVLGRRLPQKTGLPAGADLMPEAFPISDSWRAAAEGNEKAYLDCFAGEARAEAQARLARLGPDGFRKELRASAEAARGVEWGPPQRAPDGSLHFPVTVLHAADAERFDYAVAKAGPGWRIRRVEPRGRQAGPPANQGGRK